MLKYHGKRLSSRAREFFLFALKVIGHVEVYTVPQYGDAPDDQVEAWAASDCVRQIRRYAARHGKNSRPGQDALDLLKIAHYAGLAFTKLEKEGP